MDTSKLLLKLHLQTQIACTKYYNSIMNMKAKANYRLANLFKMATYHVLFNLLGKYTYGPTK